MSSILKTILFALGAVLIIVAAVIALAPTALSSSWGNALMVNYLNRQIHGGSTSFSNLELSWVGPQKIEQFELTDSEGAPIITVESFETHSTLMELLEQGLTDGKISFSGLNMTIVPNPTTGKTNLEEVLGQTLFPKSILNTLSIKEATGSFLSYDPSHVELKATGQTRYGDIAGSFNIDFQTSDQGHKWIANIDRFPVAILDAVLTLQEPSLQGLLSSFLGDALDLQVTETLINEGLTFNINANSPIFSTTISGKFESDNVIFNSPAIMKFTLTPELIRTLSKEMPRVWDLAEPTPLVLTLKQVKFPIAFFSGERDIPCGEWVLQSELAAPKIVFKNLMHKEFNATISQLFLNIQAPSENDQLTFRFMGNVAMLKDFISFDLASSFSKPKHIQLLKNSLSSPLDLQASFKDLPTILIDALCGTGERLTQALGKEISFNVLLPQNDRKSLYLSLQSANVDVSNVLVKVDQDLHFDEEMFDRDFSGHVTADQVNFPRAAPNSSLSNFYLPWKIQNHFQSFSGSFSGKIKGKNLGFLEGKFNAQNLSSDNVDFAFTCQGKQIPSVYLDLFLGRSEISSLFGESLEINVEANMRDSSGRLWASLNGDRGKIKLRSHIDNGILKLDERFEASFMATPELGSKVLGKAVPLFKELVGSQKPITITISPDHFSFPLNSSELQQIQIGQAVIDAGRMTFSNTGELHKLLGLLQASEVNEVAIWVTPIYLAIENGVLFVSRTDMLILDHYHLATWGRVDFVKDQVDMVIGITGEALSYALQIPNLNKNEMVQLPVKGKARNAKIDQAKAASRIAAILAKQRGGAEGFVLGTALDLAGGKQAKVPPPTTKPFPWGELNLPVQEANGTEKEETSHKKKNKSPLQGIEKNASKLLNKLLG